MLKAVRMQSESKVTLCPSVGIPARLVLEVEFKTITGEIIRLMPGSIVHVDTAKGIGCVDEDFFDLDKDEYVSFFQN